jgi:hypothetical protein
MDLNDDTVVCAAGLLSDLGESAWFKGLGEENAYRLGKHLYFTLEAGMTRGAFIPLNAAGQPLASDPSRTVYYYGDTDGQKKVCYRFGALKAAFAGAVDILRLDRAYIGQFTAACRSILEKDAPKPETPVKTAVLAL